MSNYGSIEEQNALSQGGNQYQGSTEQYHSQDPHKKEADLATILFVLGFFVGLVWIINFFMHRNSQSESAQKFAKYSLYLFILVLGISCCLFATSIGFSILSAIISAAAGGARPKA